MTAKPTTIKVIAKELGISPSTVSRALHDHPSIGEATRNKVKQTAKELNYEPNEQAILFQKGKTFTIGIILPELAEAFFSTAISAIEDAAYKKHYTILVAQSHDDQEREKLLVEKMKNHRVDGLIVSVGKTTQNFEHFENLTNYNIPTVFFDRIPPLKNIHYVACNIETASTAIVDFLVKKGHRSIGLINGPSALIATGQRKDGYIKALQKNRLKFDPSLVVDCDLTENGTKNALEALIANKRKPTAIVTFNDYISAYAVKHTRKLGLETDELAFVSYANTPMINFMENGPIASIEQFPAVQAQKAVDILFDLLNNTDRENQAYYKITIDSELVENN
ncbi:MAG: LacI family transcriptional regulator [Chitinophagaceae bacterium]|nr:MAG: LacI family transcriptional regulator [Chitinophagaceae bacterium]